MREGVKMRRCEDEKMRYRPPLLEEPCAQTLSGKRNPYVSNDEDLDLLTDKGVFILMITSLHLTNLGKNNYHQKKVFTAILPKVILKMMSMKGHKGYGNTSV